MQAFHNYSANRHRPYSSEALYLFKPALGNLDLSQRQLLLLPHAQQLRPSLGLHSPGTNRRNYRL